MKTARSLSLLFISLVLGAAPAANAYTIVGGDLLIRPVVGASVNVLRLDVATRETPPAGLLVGVDLDYAFTPEWGITAGLRPVLSPGFIDTQLGVGAKYRLVATEAPLIPFASLMGTVALGTPLKYGDAHFNLGTRLALGTDYFVTRDLAISAEIGAEASWLVTPIGALEVTSEALLGITYRF